MRSRVETLKRLQSLYGVVTHMHGVALEQAAAGVRESEARIEAQRAMVRQSSIESHRSLSDGDKQGWMIFEAQRGMIDRTAAGLHGLRLEREREFEAAAVSYREKRLELEQMRSVLREVHLRLEAERARREQRESDDRFLSRQRWLERRAADRMNGR